MKPKNNEVACRNAEQMSDFRVLEAIVQQSTQSKDTLAQAQYAIRAHQKQIEDFQIKIQKHVQQIAALRQEEQVLLKEQTLLEVGKLQRELCDFDKKNKQLEIEEEKHKNTMAKQVLVHENLYEGEFRNKLYGIEG